MNHTQYHARYSGRLAQIGRVAVTALPASEHAKMLRRESLALDAAVKAEAPEIVTVLIANCRRTISRINAATLADDPDTDLKGAIVIDGRAALNRLANMIRNNDPSPVEVLA